MNTALSFVGFSPIDRFLAVIFDLLEKAFRLFKTINVWKEVALFVFDMLRHIAAFLLYSYLFGGH